MNEFAPRPSEFAPAAAYCLTRVCLGLNILIHGLGRLPHHAAFSAGLEKQFAGTFLGPGLVLVAAHVIVYGETIVGFLVLTGFCLRSALIAGMGLMILLQAGTTLLADWNTAGTQLIYLALYAALLATVRFDAGSIDAYRARRLRRKNLREKRGAPESVIP